MQVSREKGPERAIRPFSYGLGVVTSGVRGGRVIQNTQLILDSVRSGTEAAAVICPSESSAVQSLAVLSSLLLPGESLFYSLMQISENSWGLYITPAIPLKPLPTGQSVTRSGLLNKSV